MHNIVDSDKIKKGEKIWQKNDRKGWVRNFEILMG